MNHSNSHEPRTARKAKQPDDFVPLHRRLFPLEQRAIARAAVREVLG